MARKKSDKLRLKNEEKTALMLLQMHYDLSHAEREYEYAVKRAAGMLCERLPHMARAILALQKKCEDTGKGLCGGLADAGFRF
jgi:hypothetical protein